MTTRRRLALVAPLLLALAPQPPLAGQLGPVATQFWSAGSPDLVTSPQALALLGSALAAGDFDCDGFDDLAVGIPDDDDNNGALANVGFVLVVYGGAGGLVAADHQVWDQQSLAQQVEDVGRDEFNRARDAAKLGGGGGAVRDSGFHVVKDTDAARVSHPDRAEKR